LLVLLAPAREHLVEEAATKLPRDGTGEGEEEQGNKTHRVV